MEIDFCRRMISEWEQKSRAASEAADLAAFEHAERELSNYRTMLAYYEKEAK